MSKSRADMKLPFLNDYEQLSSSSSSSSSKLEPLKEILIDMPDSKRVGMSKISDLDECIDLIEQKNEKVRSVNAMKSILPSVVLVLSSMLLASKTVYISMNASLSIRERMDKAENDFIYTNSTLENVTCSKLLYIYRENGHHSFSTRCDFLNDFYHANETACGEALTALCDEQNNDSFTNELIRFSPLLLGTLLYLSALIYGIFSLPQLISKKLNNKRTIKNVLNDSEKMELNSIAKKYDISFSEDLKPEALIAILTPWKLTAWETLYKKNCREMFFRGQKSENSPIQLYLNNKELGDRNPIKMIFELALLDNDSAIQRPKREAFHYGIAKKENPNQFFVGGFLERLKNEDHLASTKKDKVLNKIYEFAGINRKRFKDGQSDLIEPVNNGKEKAVSSPKVGR